MADQKISELTELTSVTNSDLIAVVDDPSGAPITKKATVGNVVSAPGLTLTTPKINDTSADHKYITAVSELTADRTVTLPLLTGNDEFVFKDHTQTLTNKTLTSPVINTNFSGTAKATGADINTGTEDAKIVTPKAIADSNLGAIAKASAWTSYTVTPTNLTIGSGTIVGKYIQVGKLVIGKIRIVLAADSSISGSVSLSKPVTSVSTSFPTIEGDCSLLDSGTAEASGRLLSASTTAFTLQVFNAAGTYLTIAALSSTVPWTWATGDVIDCKFVYEAA